MTTIASYIKYLRIHKGPAKNPAMLAATREALLLHINEGIQEAAKLLIDAKEPWMVNNIEADLVADQNNYDLNAAGIFSASTNLEQTQSFARPHSLWISSKDGNSLIEYKIVPLSEANEIWRPASQGTTVPIATLELSKGGGTQETAGGAEAKFSVRLWRPPDYASTGGLKLYYYFMPAELTNATKDAWEPGIPRWADRYVKLYSLKMLYLSEGQAEFAAAIDPELARCGMLLMETAGSNLSDDPLYVRDVSSYDYDWYDPYDVVRN